MGRKGDVQLIVTIILIVAVILIMVGLLLKGVIAPGKSIPELLKGMFGL